MTTKRIKKGFETFYQTQYTTKVDDWTHSSIFRHPRRWLASLLRNQEGACLALGCGIVDLKVLRSSEIHLVGVDISRVALLRAKEFGDVVLADGTCLPFRDSSFNSVAALDILEHVPNKTKLIREANRTLKEHGKLFLAVPIRERDYRQPFDEPPNLVSLIRLVKQVFNLSYIRGFGSKNPFNIIPYKLFRLHPSLIVKLCPYLLIGSSDVSLIAVKQD